MAQVVLSPIGLPVCAWTQGSRKFAIYVHADVLARLAMEVRVAFKRVPRRGLEIGGILLGRTERRDDTTTFWMEGFESIDCEHRSGPSYVLSEPDLVLLQAALAKKGAASIGIFRSQTRSQQLLLEEADGKLFARCFAGADALFLIVCPVAATAAFFVCEDGAMKCVYEFGLGSPLAPAVAAQRLPTGETDEAVPAPAEVQTALLAVSRPIPALDSEDTEDDAVPLADRERRPGLAIEGNRFGRALNRGLAQPRDAGLGRGAGFKKEMWLGAALIFAAFLGVGIGMLSHSRRPSVPPPAALAKDLHLTVEGNGGLLRLHWDPNFGMGNPLRAVLHIQDGDYQVVRNLAPSEFNAGSVAYEPRNRDVSFRVDVSSPTANASGLVQVVNLSPPAPAPIPPAEPLVELSAKSTVTELSPSKTSAARSEAPAAPIGKEKEENRATDNGSSAGNDAVSSVKSDASPAKVIDKEAQPVIAERAATAAPLQEPTVRVWTEAVAGSPWRRLMGKVPLLRRLKKTAKTTTPAPIFQAQPVLTDPAKDSITRPVSVDVRVDVAESGVVESAEVVEFSDPLNGALVNSALAAAVRWTFEPARSEEGAVASRVILHFRFTP